MTEVSIVVPTLDERDNLAPFLLALESALPGIDYEVIFVDDDSPDGTADVARRIAQQDRRVRILERIGRRGLSSAVLEGMMATSAPYLAVMDSDLQHDETVLPVMLRKLREERLDMVVATRLSEGGSMGEMTAWRCRLSDWGRTLGALICRIRLSDPMSGYFVVTREYVQAAARRTSGTGFKILLDLVASGRNPPRFAEIPYRFRPRRHGRSKLDIVVAVEYLELIADKLVGDFVPASYVMFACAGTVGVVVHLAVVQLLRRAPGLSLDQAQFTSSAIVIVVNFFLNNRLTFRSARLRGGRLVAGMALFYVACSVGLFLNLQVLDYLAGLSVSWYAAAAAGLAVGSVWNYWVSAMFIWQVRRRAARSPLAARSAQAQE